MLGRFFPLGSRPFFSSRHIASDMHIMRILHYNILTSLFGSFSPFAIKIFPKFENNSLTSCKR